MFRDFFRRKVICLTCHQRVAKTDCHEYPFVTWAGDASEYECKTCAVTRQLEGKPLLNRDYYINQYMKNRPVGMM